MKGKLLNDGYKPAPKPLAEQRGYLAKPVSVRPVPPTPPKTTSSIVKPKG